MVAGGSLCPPSTCISLILHLLLHLLQHLLHSPQLLILHLDQFLRLSVWCWERQDRNGAFYPVVLSQLAGHLLDALSSVVLIVDITSDILQVMHVCPDQHIPQLHKVAVCLIFHFHNAPWVQPTTDSLAFSFHHCVAANDSKRSTLLQLSVLLLELLIFIRVALRKLVHFNTKFVNLFPDPLF